jgi:hypothetical protein
MPLARGKISVAPDEDPQYDSVLDEYRTALEKEDKKACEAARMKLSAMGRANGFVRN